jgi:2'-5' RNA ligase
MSEQRMADHWWWRPGWSVGRRFYAWHLTFPGPEATDLRRFAAEYRAALKPLPGLDPIPDEWLHLTMQGLGFIDEVDSGDVDAIVEAARIRLAGVAPFILGFDRPVIDPEAVLWRVDPAGPGAVRDAIRAAIGDVWPIVPEGADGFVAHVSAAYSSSDGPQAAVREALDRVEAAPATVRIGEAQLIVMHRDHRMYEWTTHTSIPLGGAREA